MNRQHTNDSSAVRRAAIQQQMSRLCSPTFPTDPGLPHEEMEHAVRAWHRSQLAMLRLAFGARGWPLVDVWVRELLRHEVRVRLAAIGWRLKDE